MERWFYVWHPFFLHDQSPKVFHQQGICICVFHALVDVSIRFVGLPSQHFPTDRFREGSQCKLLVYTVVRRICGTTIWPQLAQRVLVYACVTFVRDVAPQSRLNLSRQEDPQWLVRICCIWCLICEDHVLNFFGYRNACYLWTMVSYQAISFWNGNFLIRKHQHRGACAQSRTLRKGAQPWKEPAPQNTLFTNLHIEQSTCPKNRLEVIANGVTIHLRHPLFGGRGCIIGGTFPDCLYACDKRRFQPSVVRQHLNFVGPPMQNIVPWWCPISVCRRAHNHSHQSTIF